MAKTSGSGSTSDKSSSDKTAQRTTKGSGTTSGRSAQAAREEQQRTDNANGGGS